MVEDFISDSNISLIAHCILHTLLNEITEHVVLKMGLNYAIKSF